MPKSAHRRLKVFQAQVGFYDTVVAAPSQVAALEAWGIHQNLFTEKLAHVTDDAAAAKAALAQPGIPLRRPIGSDDDFAAEPTGAPKLPDAPPKRKTKLTSKQSARPPKRSPDRTKLDAAERALRDVDEARDAEEAELQHRQEQLDAEQADAQTAYVASRKVAKAAVVEARRAYQRAGGTD